MSVCITIWLGVVFCVNAACLCFVWGEWCRNHGQIIETCPKFNSTVGRYGELTLFQDVFRDVVLWWNHTFHTLNSMYQTHATTMKLLETPSCSLTPFHLLPPKGIEELKKFLTGEIHPERQPLDLRLNCWPLTWIKHIYLKTSWYDWNLHQLMKIICF